MRPPTSDPVVITGIGLITPFGVGLDPNRAALRADGSACKPLTRIDASTWPVKVGGELPEIGAAHLGLFHNKLRGMGNYVRIGILAAQQALAESGLDRSQVPADRIGAFIASGTNGNNAEGLFPAFDVSRAGDDTLDLAKLATDGIDRVHPWWLLGTISNNLIFFVTHFLNLKGANANACNSAIAGASMLDRALESLESGEIDVALVGGADCPLNWQMISDLACIGLLAEGDPADVLPPRSFSERSRGAVLSDAAAFLVLERESAVRARGGKVLAIIQGTSLFGGFADPIVPAADGHETRHVMEALLAGVADEAPLQINASATGHPVWDRSEQLGISAAIRDAGAKVHRRGSPTRLGAVKPRFGHGYSISFILETALSVLALQEQIGLCPGCDGTLPDLLPGLEPAPAGAFPHRWAINLGQCFGGHTAGILLRAPGA